MSRPPTHGMTKHPIYRAWVHMRDRCYRPNDERYADYGGRGIKVCDRWLESFENFRDDMFPTWQKGLSIDRIDNDGNYEPSNCRWATRAEQEYNKRVQGVVPYRGVHRHREKYMAQIKIEGKKKYLGVFDTPEEARDAYNEAYRTIRV